jgi:hypothetical protein
MRIDARDGSDGMRNGDVRGSRMRAVSSRRPVLTFNQQGSLGDRSGDWGGGDSGGAVGV